MGRHQDVKVKHFDVSDVICHKFLHGAVSYTLNGENVNVMLEYFMYPDMKALHKTFQNCQQENLQTLESLTDMVHVSNHHCELAYLYNEIICKL